MNRKTLGLLVILALSSLLWPTSDAAAQGVTTSAISGVVKDSQGAVIPGATVVAVHEPSGTTYEAVTSADGRFSHPGHAHRRALQGHRGVVRIPHRGTDRDHADARRRAGPVVQSWRGDCCRNRDRHQRVESGVQLDANRRRDVGVARRAGGAADGLGTHQRHHATDATVRRQRHVRRPGQPDEQHHRRRLVLQQLVRPRRSARRSHGRRADFARSHRTGAGQRRALRRPAGQLRRRRREHRHAQRHQPPDRERVSPLPQRVVRRHRGQGSRLQSRRLQHEQHGRVGRRSDSEEQAVRVRQLREAGRHAAALDVRRQHRRHRPPAATSRACSPATSMPSAR